MSIARFLSFLSPSQDAWLRRKQILSERNDAVQYKYRSIRDNTTLAAVYTISIQEHVLSSMSAIVFNSAVLAPADADAQRLVTAKQDRQYYLPPLMLKKAGDAECRTLGMTSTGGDSDLTDAARRLRAEV